MKLIYMLLVLLSVQPTTGFAAVPNPAVDPQQILFSGLRVVTIDPWNVEIGIYLVGTDGRLVQSYFPDTKDVEGDPTWSPDGKQIAFTSNRDCTQIPCTSESIYLMDISGKDARMLVNGTVYYASPKWSPDGVQIAYLSDENSKGKQANSECILSTISIDATDSRRISRFDSCYIFRYGTALEWSPDGKTIALGAEFEIYLVNIENGTSINLTNTPSIDMMPSWSPDGKEIVFASNRNGNYDVFLMDADGSNVRPLTDTPEDETEPVWSPDGSYIVFGTYSELYRISPDGSNLIKLTGDVDTYHEVYSPAISPDSRQIVFTLDEGAGARMPYIVDSDGTGEHWLNNEYYDSVAGYQWRPLAAVGDG